MVAEIGDELWAVRCHSKEASHTTHRCWVLGWFDGFNFLRIRWDTLAWKYKPKERHWTLVELTLLCLFKVMQTSQMLLKRTVMLWLRFSKYDNVITDVEHSRNVTNLLANNILENFTGRVRAKIQSGISSQPFVSCKRRDATTFWLIGVGCIQTANRALRSLWPH